ncbi:MAG TPA: NADH-quinone oxidoreductase subunit F, partial [bacterium]|nr:NADH-quinone oxidoreductase subunit F [bacterium]
MYKKFLLLSKHNAGSAEEFNRLVNYTIDKIQKSNLTADVSVKIRVNNYYSGNDIILSILPENYNYAKVDERIIDKIIDEYLIKGKEVKENRFDCNELVNRFYENFGNYNYFNKQLRLTLRNCGIIDPESLDDYFKVDGFRALAKVLTEMSPQDVIDEIKKSGLRGRGGGGYPTFQKWTNGARAEGKQKYIICNADEGDPGAFMDRSTIEGDPFSVIEGMAIAGYAVGADKGFVYIRAEYPLAIKRLENAIKLANENNLIGKNILG